MHLVNKNMLNRIKMSTLPNLAIEPCIYIHIEIEMWRQNILIEQSQENPGKCL